MSKQIIDIDLDKKVEVSEQIQASEREYTTKPIPLKIVVSTCVGIGVLLACILLVCLLGDKSKPTVPSSISETSTLENTNTSLELTDFLADYTNTVFTGFESQYPVQAWSLFTKYSDVVGYITVEDLDIGYPIVQGTDNEYYLTRDYKGMESKSGSIFLDYRNSLNSLDKHTILYGHNMADGTMFAGLLKLFNPKINPNDIIIYLQTPEYNRRYELVSAYTIDLTTFNYIQTYWPDEKAYDTFLKQCLSYNQLDSLQETLNTDNRLLTFSTCVNAGKDRLVVHAKLVEEEKV